MNILITGSSGLIGSSLSLFLSDKGHCVSRLMRDSSRLALGEVFWDPDSGVLDGAKIEGFDAVVHLAGKNLAAGRWNGARKTAIRESRVRSTRLLCETLSRLEQPPKVLASASAVGIYGNRGSEWLTEKSSLGGGFLAEVGRQWEAATQPASDRGIRVVHLRLGIVLSPRGGALAKMVLPFKLGLGGVIGSGQQYWSWIAIHDAVEAIHHVLNDGALNGPLNVVSPEPVTNREFTRTLGNVLGRPTVFPVPALIARIVFGEMADEALLASTRVAPAKLANAGFGFQHRDLRGALRCLLQK